jgi:pilus assembly protein Flp/PilA
MLQLISRLRRDDEGQDLIEYALLAAFIALAALLAMQFVGGGINTLFTNVSDQLNNASKPKTP